MRRLWRVGHPKKKMCFLSQWQKHTVPFAVGNKSYFLTEIAGTRNWVAVLVMAGASLIAVHSMLSGLTGHIAAVEDVTQTLFEIHSVEIKSFLMNHNNGETGFCVPLLLFCRLKRKLFILFSFFQCVFYNQYRIEIQLQNEYGVDSRLVGVALRSQRQLATS